MISIAADKPHKRRRRIWLGVALLASALVAAVAVVVSRPRVVATWVTEYLESRQHETRPVRLVKPGEWQELDAGLSFRRVKMRRVGRWFSSFNVLALRVDPARFDLRVIDVPTDRLDALDIESLAVETGAIALLNTSYFEPDMKVMGLVIADGKKLSPLRHAGNIHHGVWYLRGGRAFLVHRTNADFEGATQAFQAGPWMVTDGEAMTRFRNANIVTRRSAVAVDKRGRVILLATDALIGGLSLPELAGLLATPEPEGLGAWRAINCDGGTSTQMILRHPKRSFAIRTTMHVPVYLGVFPAAQRPPG